MHRLHTFGKEDQTDDKTDQDRWKWVAIVGLFCTVMALALPWRTILTGIGLLAAGFLFTIIFRSVNSTPKTINRKTRHEAVRLREPHRLLSPQT